MEPEFDPVCRRTRAGQQQAVSGAFELSSDGSRLLLLVNGLTAASGLRTTWRRLCELRRKSSSSTA